MLTSFHEEVEKFRVWALNYPLEERSGEWECDYEGWRELSRSFTAYLDSHSPNGVTNQAISDLLYAIARDNEMEELISELVERPRWFSLLLPGVVEWDEPDAKGTFAVALGSNVLPFAETERALLTLVDDQHEYVSRRALQSLGRIGSNHAEDLCERAWETNHEYQRIMALWVLKEIGSSKLGAYLARAKEDGREYLVCNAIEIETHDCPPQPTGQKQPFCPSAVIRPPAHDH